MNILWIISSGWKEGGAENYVTSLRPILEQQGHTVKILASDDHPEKPHFNEYAYRTHHGVLRPFFHVFNISAYRTLKDVLRTFNPDVVHIHTFGHASGAILFPLKNYPTVMTVHGPESFIKGLRLWCFPRSYFKNGMYAAENLTLAGRLRFLYHQLLTDPVFHLGLHNVDTIISPSAYIRELIAREGFSSVYIPNGIRLFSHSPLTQETYSPTVVYVGRLEPLKGVDILLRAFAKVSVRFPDARLLVAGDGSDRERLETIATELGILPVVQFLGYVDVDTLVATYVRAAFAVVPSMWMEAFGLVGVEAMSVGRPVIASDVGGVSSWMVDGETGFLVPPGDVAALVAAMTRFFEHPELVLSMGKKARGVSEKFGIDSHATDIIRVYTDTISYYAK
ncbi:MAG: glycosyltransferase family 4 protein [Candidatus Yonathbacteria bacterium]|nr:glycosyltransferase family 4 protein [Candidatus Yonathbacteria bacterium]